MARKKKALSVSARRKGCYFCMYFNSFLKQLNVCSKHYSLKSVKRHIKGCHEYKCLEGSVWRAERILNC